MPLLLVLGLAASRRHGPRPSSVGAQDQMLLLLLVLLLVLLASVDRHSVQGVQGCRWTATSAISVRRFAVAAC